jgi:HK97 family phage major capsid protein
VKFDKAKHKKLLEQIKARQEEFRGKAMPEDKAAELETWAGEAKAMQDEADRDARIKALLDGETRLSRVPDGQVPDDETAEQKAAREQKAALETKAAREKVVGYMKLGQFVLASKGFAAFRQAGKHAQGTFRLVQGVKNLRERFIAITAAQLEEMKASVPTLGDGVIEPTRIPELVRVTEHDRLVLRDILNVSQTSSNAVKFTRITNYQRGALAVAHGAKKPDASITLDTVIEPVRKIAVWMPVEDEQLDDVPALAGMINGELLYDLGKHEEELIMYGSGVGEEFNGICVNPLVLQCGNGPVAGGGRVKTTDTLIDIVRRGITDVLTAGYTPNGVLIHPFDWEDVILQKGTDKRYVWVVVTDGQNMRLWAVTVVETMAMQDFQGLQTEERNLVVGDFMRGAVLWDREDAAVSVGWVDQQFIENKRTILAEWRGAFGTWRPGAFRKWRTEEASQS